jgi:MerR family transcriptional regulator, thiopeptide resistance regulator
MSLTVSQVAKLTGITVRTLHHYDEIGLLRPSGRTEAGYRLYADEDLVRLQQVLFFRELGFPLEEISRMLSDPSFDLRSALLMQRRMLTERKTRVEALIDAVEAALDALEEGRTMNKEEMFEVFGDFDPAKYEDEARQRWGNSDAYKESMRRTKRYTKADWLKVKEENGRIYGLFAECMKAKLPPSDARAMDAAEEHRQSIVRWFYPCSHQMHVGLGELYISDGRFTENIDRFGAGLAQYMRDAIRENAKRNGVTV